MKTLTYILGGCQTDFARNVTREGGGLYELLRDSVVGALENASINAKEIQSAHIGNFVGELFTGQGQLGGMLAAIDPAFYGIPAGRHEGACASGGLAILAAMAEIEAGRYDCILVSGVEVEKSVPGKKAAEHLGAAMWVGQEGQEAQYPWPYMFHIIGREYAKRYGLKYEHLAYIAELNLDNAKRNPNAQTRDWTFHPESFAEDDVANPVIEGMIRRQDCGQVTDGAATVVLASPSFAKKWAARVGRSFDTLPVISGWGHRTAHLKLEEKLRVSQASEYVFPHVRSTIVDAFGRAGVNNISQLSGIETHDCFTMTEYMAIDHFGITNPGESWQAIEDGTIAFGGRLPINPSGGLIGCGHPVGATGVRMVLDSALQVTDAAGAYQVPGAKRFATLNIGGSATTVISFVIQNADA